LTLKCYEIHVGLFQSKNDLIQAALPSERQFCVRSITVAEMSKTFLSWVQIVCTPWDY